jgi:hypothetical protein
VFLTVVNLLLFIRDYLEPVPTKLKLSRHILYSSQSDASMGIGKFEKEIGGLKYIMIFLYVYILCKKVGYLKSNL